MTKPKNELESGSTHHERVEIDISYLKLQADLEELDPTEFAEFRRCVEKIQQMTWAQILATSSKTQKRGLNWEVLDQVTASGRAIASIRISGKFRARVTRERACMRFISLHPDHDSAYDEPGGEKI